jgi:hypothetical protein
MMIRGPTSLGYSCLKDQEVFLGQGHSQHPIAHQDACGACSPPDLLYIRGRRWRYIIVDQITHTRVRQNKEWEGIG